MEFLSYNNISAADGFGTVFIAALCGFGALALIYAVLVVMNKVHEKNNRNNDTEKTEEADALSRQPLLRLNGFRCRTNKLSPDGVLRYAER